MKRFLRLFPEYRDLDRKLEMAAQARIRAEDEVRELRAELRVYRQELQDARDRKDRTLERVSDFFAREHTGRSFLNPEERDKVPDGPREPVDLHRRVRPGLIGLDEFRDELREALTNGHQREDA